MIQNINNAVLFTLIGAFLGIILLLFASILVPRLMARITPRIDEEKELVRGNRAVGDYYGRVVAAVIIGISIIIGSAIIAGILG